MSEAAPAVADVPDSLPTNVDAELDSIAARDSEPTPAAKSTKADAPAAPAAPRKMKAKVYGEEREVSADAVEAMARDLGIPPEFILRNLQTSAAAQKRFQEAAELAKKAEERNARMKKDPWAVLKEEAGLDPDQAAIARVEEIMRREAMNPDQRARAEAERRAEEAEKKLQAQETERETQMRHAETQKHIEALNQALPAAAEAAGLPRSPAVGRMMIDFMLSQARAGAEVSPEDAAQYARETVQTWTGDALRSMRPEQLESFLGPDVIKAILQHQVAKVRGQPAAAPAAATSTPAKKEPSFLSPAEWRARFG